MRTHLSFPTRDLNAAAAFYSVLLDTPPAKRLDDYVLFLTDEPALELALNPAGSAVVDGASHFGIAVERSTLVDRAIERFEHAGLEVDVEVETTCCYAKQNKVWATDPDGRRWEVYHVLEETEERDSVDSTCCGADNELDATCCSSSGAA